MELGNQLDNKINLNPNSQIVPKCRQTDMNEAKVMAETVESTSTSQVNLDFGDPKLSESTNKCVNSSS